jgi:hypothetical protein
VQLSRPTNVALLVTGVVPLRQHEAIPPASALQSYCACRSARRTSPRACSHGDCSMRALPACADASCGQDLRIQHVEFELLCGRKRYIPAKREFPLVPSVLWRDAPCRPAKPGGFAWN